MTAAENTEPLMTIPYLIGCYRAAMRDAEVRGHLVLTATAAAGLMALQYGTARAAIGFCPGHTGFWGRVRDQLAATIGEQEALVHSCNRNRAVVDSAAMSCMACRKGVPHPNEFQQPHPARDLEGAMRASLDVHKAGEPLGIKILASGKQGGR